MSVPRESRRWGMDPDKTRRPLVVHAPTRLQQVDRTEVIFRRRWRSHSTARK